MTIPRDNSPERISDQDRLQLETRRHEVRADVYFALSAMYNERADIWGAPAQAQVAPTPKVNTASIIDHAFLKANIDAQASELASDRAISEAQRSVSEALDELYS